MRALAERGASWVWVVLIAFLLADLTSAALEERLMLPPVAAPSKSASPALPSAPAAAIPGELVSVLDTRPPEAIIEAGSTEGDPAAAPVASNPLNISLKGTIIGAGGVSLAVIDDGSGETKLLSTGEKIGELTLVDVGAHEATFRQGTETRVLSLMDSSDSSAAPPSMAQRPVAVNTPVAPASPSAPIKPPETMAEMQELLNDPAKASDGFKLTPINRKGQSYGVMLEFRKSSNLMSAIGLRHGDILLSVNGRPLKSGEDMYTAYQEMRNSPNVSFEVDRGGQVVPIKFEVKP